MKIGTTPCPACQALPPTLAISLELAAKPLGTFSLAGAQMKVAANTVPVLTCASCSLRLVGQIDPDQRHATFLPPRDEASGE